MIETVAQYAKKMAIFGIFLLWTLQEISCSTPPEVVLPRGVKNPGRAAFQEGLAALRARRHRAALAWFRLAHRHGFAEAQTATGEGLAWSGLQNLMRARRAFDRAITCDPRQAEPYIRRGLILHHLKKYGAALRDFNRGLALSPGHAIGHMGRAFTLYSLGRYTAALSDARAALRAGSSLPEGFLGALRRRAVSSRAPD